MKWMTRSTKFSCSLATMMFHCKIVAGWTHKNKWQAALQAKMFIAWFVLWEILAWSGFRNVKRQKLNSFLKPTKNKDRLPLFKKSHRCCQTLDPLHVWTSVFVHAATLFPVVEWDKVLNHQTECAKNIFFGWGQTKGPNQWEQHSPDLKQISNVDHLNWILY